MNTFNLFRKASDDPEQRIRDFLKKFEPKLRRRYLEVINLIKERLDLEQLAIQIETGFFDLAFDQIEREFVAFTDEISTIFVEAGKETAAFLNAQGLAVTINFDQVNERAVRRMRENRLELIREFMQSQRDVVNSTMIEGIQRGLNPRQQAREFRSVVGLTDRQEAAVRNYRRLLEDLDSSALKRKLRDGRFDRSVLRAIKNSEPLTKEQIDNMVQRYRERYIKYRAETIARTEALKTVHQGANEMFDQAIDGGTLTAEELIGEWNTAGGPRVRDSHAPMNGQKRSYNQSFLSGSGNPLRYPHDPAAPAEERINCRCIRSIRIISL